MDESFMLARGLSVGGCAGGLMGCCVRGYVPSRLLLFTFRRRLHHCRPGPKRRDYHGLSVMADATPGHDGIELQPGRRNDVWEPRNAVDDDATSGEV